MKWLLWIGGLVALVVFGYLGIERLWDTRLFGKRDGVSSENLNVRQARALLAAEPGITILDVRSEAEQASGTLEGAVCAPRKSAAFQAFLEEADKDRPVLVYCAGGMRSRLAIGTLREAGFTRLYHLDRGYLAWKWRGQAEPPTDSSK